MHGTSETVLGPLLLGQCLGFVGYGFLIMQTYFFFQTFTHERFVVKAYVALIVLLETVYAAISLDWIWVTFVVGFGSSQSLHRITWALVCVPAITVTIACFTQLFYARRVLILVGSKLACGVIVVLSLATFACGWGMTFDVGHARSYEHLGIIKSMAIPWFILAITCDATITLVLVWHLSRQRTGFESTDTMVSRVINMTVQTAMAATICAILKFSIELAVPTGLWMLFSCLQSKTYSLSLLGVLNARAGLRFSGPMTASTSELSDAPPTNKRLSLLSPLGGKRMSLPLSPPHAAWQPVPSPLQTPCTEPDLEPWARQALPSWNVGVLVPDVAAASAAATLSACPSRRGSDRQSLDHVDMEGRRRRRLSVYQQVARAAHKLSTILSARHSMEMNEKVERQLDQLV